MVFCCQFLETLAIQFTVENVVTCFLLRHSAVKLTLRNFITGFASSFNLWSICLQVYQFHYSCLDFTHTVAHKLESCTLGVFKSTTPKLSAWSTTLYSIQNRPTLNTYSDSCTHQYLLRFNAGYFSFSQVVNNQSCCEVNVSMHLVCTIFITDTSVHVFMASRFHI